MSEVIVYSTPLCAPCERLKRHLRERGVAFKVIDIMMDEEAGPFLKAAASAAHRCSRSMANCWAASIRNKSIDF